MASPSSPNLALGARPDGETKVSQLVNSVRSRVKLDFIPSEERTSRARRGYPSMSSPEGSYGVEAHGAPDSIFCKNGDPMSANDLAWWIKNDSRYGAGMTVFLMCCETGKGSHCFAQQLADILGATVVAPTEKLWPLQDGGFVVAKERTKRTLGIFTTTEQRADTERLGEMRTFAPSATATTIATSARSETAVPVSGSNELRSVVVKKPMLRASARTAAMLAMRGSSPDNTVFLNSKAH